MSNDIDIRIEGRAGRVTLNRPDALNALTHAMCLEITAALVAWEGDAAVDLLIFDAAGEKAFCAGGDIAEMYATGRAGDFAYGRRFWADEYRMNARIFEFPKPVVSFLQGYTMGGGVGVGCHASHRIVCETSRIAMPECGIGLVPDVGGSLLLARAPGRLGEYLGTCAARMGPGDAILAEFADYFVPRAEWDALIATLVESGDWEAVDRAARPAPEAAMAALRAQIDALFDGETIRDIRNALRASGTEFAQEALRAMDRNSPLAVACTVELVHRVRAVDRIDKALEQEYRYSWRAMERSDFIEGIRAAIIDKDRTPRWRHENADSVSPPEITAMLMPLGAEALKLDGGDVT